MKLHEAYQVLLQDPRDNEAWTAVVEGTRDRTLAILVSRYRLIRSDAEDCYQHVLTGLMGQFLRNLVPPMIGEADLWFHNYILRAARNAATDLLRLRRRSLELHEALKNPAQPDEEDPDLVKRFRLALKDLPNDQQTVLQGMVEGRDDAELAEALSTKPSHIRVLRFRAIRRLRGLLL